MFDGSRIFVSGATGSWGQTLITMLLSKYNVEEIVCFSRRVTTSVNEEKVQQS